MTYRIYKKGHIRMIKTIKRLITSLSIGTLFLMPLAPVTVYAAECLDGNSGSIADCLNAGADKTDPDAASRGPADERVNSAIRLVINLFSVVVGVISVIMIIIGGLKYITSGGDSGNITGAKNTILYAIIGLVVVALAQVVVKFVLQKAAA